MKQYICDIIKCGYREFILKNYTDIYATDTGISDQCVYHPNTRTRCVNCCYICKEPIFDGSGCWPLRDVHENELSYLMKERIVQKALQE